MTIPAFGCDVRKASDEEKREFLRLLNERTSIAFKLQWDYCGIDAFGYADGWNIPQNAITAFTRLIPISEGISILKKALGEEDEQEKPENDGWISVKDKMPSINIEPGVLVYCIDRSISIQSVYNDGKYQPTFGKGWGKVSSMKLPIGCHYLTHQNNEP